jgi:hypothetical protein
VDASGYAPEWLRLREGADAAARAVSLVDKLALRSPLTIRDLGCGTGSMGRWLAGRLPGPQHWILHDRDPRLLTLAARSLPDGVTTETEQLDVTRLTAVDLAETSLVTASALLDLFTAAEIGRLADACAGAHCPALLTLSVVGRVELSPANPLDDTVMAAFNAHQRREGRLGPDAVSVAAQEFTDRGYTVHRAPSVWRLGPADSALITAWFHGWVEAATQEDPDLTRYRDQPPTTVTVHHEDLLALP